MSNAYDSYARDVFLVLTNGIGVLGTPPTPIPMSWRTTRDDKPTRDPRAARTG